MKNTRIKCDQCGKRRIARIIDQSRAGEYLAFCSRRCSNTYQQARWRKAGIRAKLNQAHAIYQRNQEIRKEVE